MTQEVLKLALEALEKMDRVMKRSPDTDKAITVIKEALREHAMREVQRLGQEIEQEPAAWMKPHEKCDRACMYLCTKGFTQFPECTSLQRTWVGLTDKELHDCLNGLPTQTIDVYARRIEAKLKELNT